MATSFISKAGNKIPLGRIDSSPNRAGRRKVQFEKVTSKSTLARRADAFKHKMARQAREEAKYRNGKSK